MDQNQRAAAADEVKAAMERQSLSAATVAAKAGVSKNTMTRLLRAENVQQGSLFKVRDALDIQPRTTTREFDADVETTALAVKTWLADLDSDHRPGAIADLIQCVVSGAVRRAQSHPNG